MSELNLSELKFTEIDIKNFVNSSLDVEEGSVLFINHDDKDKLDKYVDESLKEESEASHYIFTIAVRMMIK